MSPANTQTSDRIPPPRLTGPDFVVGEVKDWHPAEGVLNLVNGSSWIVQDEGAGSIYAREIIALAMRYREPILVSGDQASGRVERVESTERLAPHRLDEIVKDGRLMVLFHMKPSFYYLYEDRPWFKQARSLLREAVQEDGPGLPMPELLVSIDARTLEIVDVRRE